jgi:hypothetical protein
MDDVSEAVSRIPLGAIGDAGLDRGHLRFVIAVDLARKGLELHTQFLGLGGGALFHLYKERVGVCLGDQAGRHRVLRLCGACHQADTGNGGHQKFLHGLLPETDFRTPRPTLSVLCRYAARPQKAAIPGLCQ